MQLRRFPDDVLAALYAASDEAMRELVENDPMAARVYASFKPFYDAVRDYHHISEQAYINARDEVLEN